MLNFKAIARVCKYVGAAGYAAFMIAGVVKEAKDGGETPSIKNVAEKTGKEMIKDMMNE